MAYDVSALEVAYGLPTGLYASLINNGERSGPNAVSPKGASGPAQLMPGTAKDLGVDPSDPQQNLAGGARYLKQLLDRYRGDASKAVEAYNEGMGRVDRGVVYPETAKYVERVLGKDVMPTTGTGDVTQSIAPILQQILAAGKPDAAQQGLYRQYSDQSEATAKGLQASNENLKAIQSGMAGLKSPDAPTSGAMPDAAEMQKQELAKVSDQPQDSMRVLGQFMPVLAIVGGAFMKKSSMAALQAATGAMNGAKANDKEAIEKAHADFTDAMNEVKTRFEQQHQAYQDAREKYGDDRAGFAAQMSIQEAQDKNDLALEALRGGHLDQYTKMKDAGLAAYEKVVPLITAAQYHQDQAEARNAGIDPSKRAYNDALATGKSEDEALDVLRRTENAEHPTAATKVGEREESIMVADPVIKAARTNQQYINNIEGVDSEDLKSGAGQVRLLDSFTRLATNQAIRGFMVKNADEYKGLAGKAETIFKQNNIDPNNPPAAPFLDQAQINAYLEQGRKMVKEIRQVEGKQFAQHASNMEGRGIDPSQGGLTGADLELAMENGYKPDPSKWSLSKADQGGGAPAAEVPSTPPKAALPADLPSAKGHPDGSKIKDGSGKIIAVVKNGQWVAP